MRSVGTVCLGIGSELFGKPCWGSELFGNLPCWGCDEH